MSLVRLDLLQRASGHFFPLVAKARPKIASFSLRKARNSRDSVLSAY